MATKRLSGQVTVATAGTVYPLGATRVEGSVWLRTPTGNTGIIYIGNDGTNTVSASTGFAMNADTLVVLDYVFDLSNLYVTASANGDKITWLTLNSRQVV